MTSAYYLIGGDVAASPSPAMMNAAFKALGIDAAYSGLSVKSGLLVEAFQSLRAHGVAGANITIPHKSAVLPLLEGYDEVSSRIKAVNTIVHNGIGFEGFNTDVNGIEESLASRGVTRVGRALVVGAGGAARAFCQAASSLGCEAVAVVVRDPTRASVFLRDMRSAFPGTVFTPVRPMDAIRSDVELIFNASPAGTPDIPMPANVMDALQGGMVVFDAVYRPVDTELLSAASRLGCVTIKGHEMLLNQAAATFEGWTHQRAPKELMRTVLLRELGVGQE